MLISALVAAASGAGVSPDDRVEVWADTGILTGQVGAAFGLGAGTVRGPLSVSAIAGAGGRGDLFGTGVSNRPGFGLGTVSVGLGEGMVEVVGLLDFALLDAVEENCALGVCRHGLFIGGNELNDFGMSFQPAGILRIKGQGASGAGFSMGFGLQPHRFKNADLPFALRLEFVVMSQRNWSLHAWAGRYGMAVGVGHRLSRPRDSAVIGS